MFKIREALLSDVEAIMEAEAAGIEHPWDRASIEALIKDDNKTALVACSDNTVAGYIGASFVCDEAETGNLCVLPKFRRMGAGRMLFEALSESLKQKGIRYVFLEVDPDNRAAVALYESLGFKALSRRKDYYAPGKDADIYRLTLL